MYSSVALLLYIASVSAFVPHHPSILGSRIVGGTDADEGAAPHQVSLRDNWNFHFCGGFIISENAILTAAHCVIRSNPAFITAVVGTNSLGVGGDRYGIRSMTHHAQYDHRFYFNDISILRTENITLRDRVQPIRLPTQDTKEGATMTLTGWGSTSLGGPAPDKLQTIAQRAVSMEECQQRHWSHPIVASQICAFTVAGEGACHGDSGSALVEDGRVVGIVSWGRPCAMGYPDVYTRVYSFLAWIEQHVNQY